MSSSSLPGGGERGLQPAWSPRDWLVDAEVAQHGLDVGIDGVLESFGDSSSECRVFRSVLSVPSYREVFWEQAGGCQGYPLERVTLRVT